MLTFQRELRAYEALLPQMLRDGKGQFVVIQGDDVRQVLPTYEDALNWAYQHFGLERFFVKQIDAQEHVAHFSRDLGQ